MRQNKALIHITFIVSVFFVLIGSAVISFAVDDSVYSTQEARMLSRFTAPSCENLLDGSWFRLFEDYNKDQFVQREHCMTSYYAFLDFLHVNERNGYVRGKGNQILNVRSFRESPSHAEAARNFGIGQADAMAKIAAAADEYGGKVIYMNIPYRMEFYANMYPQFYANGKEITTIQRASIIEKAKQQGIAVVETYDLLRSHEDEYIFFTTDHHWTIRGAYYGYQELLKCINQDNPQWNLQFPSFDDLKVSASQERMVGSYLRVWGDGGSISNDYMEYAIPYDMPAYSRFDNGEPSELPLMDVTFNGYGAFMYGDHANTLIDTSRPDLPSVLYIGFSYTNPLEVLSVYNFDTVESLDPRHWTGSICEHVRESQADYVVIVKDDIYEGNREFVCHVE